MTRYPATIKAQVLAALLEGQAVTRVAEDYNIPEGTVYSWKSREINGHGSELANHASEKKEQIGDLLLEYLSESLITLRKQAEMFRNEGWLKKQNAADVAVLHGVVTDKVIRLLEALSTVNDNETK